jgi:microcystin-dependent protein
MWSGSLATIPAGWGLCDGAGGRPDLRNRFIVGAGLGYAVGVTGGADVVILSEANLPAHAHPASASGSSDDVNLVHSHPFSGSSGTGGSHNHSYFVSDYSNFGGDELFPGSNYTAERLPTVTSDHTGHTHPISGTVGDALGNHSHPITVSVTVDATGSNAAHENRPPFYALAFIIKL